MVVTALQLTWGMRYWVAQVARWSRRSVLAAVAILMTALTPWGFPGVLGSTRAADPGGIHKIQHVVIIMQENRTFDSYFGTYPGADGIPMQNGTPTVCVLNPRLHACQRPYHDEFDRNAGGPHGHGNAKRDIAGGEMDGFIAQAELGREHYCRLHVDDPRCSNTPNAPDLMGYHDWHEIP